MSLDANRQRIRFPFLSLGAVLIVSLLVTLGLVWQKAYVADEYNKLATLSSEINAELGRIALMDETLTMSAKMAAHTGDQSWVQRYNEAVPFMDQSLARISEISPPALVETLDTQTAAANDLLIALEEEALNLVSAGQAAQAQAILNSEEYVQAKTQLTNGAIEFEENLLADTAVKKAALDQQVTQSIWISVFGIAVIVVSWAGLYRTLLKWRAGLKEAAQRQADEEARRQKQDQAEKEAEQERLNQAAHERRAMLHKMAEKLDQNVSSILNATVASSQEMNQSANTMLEMSDKTLSQATEVANSAQEASANVQTVASASEELGSSINEITHQVDQAAQIAQRAVKDADQTNSQIQGLNEAAQKIGEVVSLITTIADQTNLLALNATIEAARAGESGKGFAVVASEVKNLANQTAKATEDIVAQITDIQHATQASVQSVQNIGKTISEIESISSVIAAAIEEQGAATQEIARNVEQASGGTQGVSAKICDVSSAAEETGAASQKIVEGTRTLEKEMADLQKQISDLIGELKAS